MIWYNVSREIVVDMYGLEVRKAQTLNVKEKRLQFLKLVDPILDLPWVADFESGGRFVVARLPAE